MELTNKQHKLVEKVKKDLPEFVEDTERMSTAQMEDTIVRFTADLAEIAKSLEANLAYQTLKEQVKLIDSGVNASKTVINNKIKYLVIAIEEKGGSPNTNPRG